MNDTVTHTESDGTADAACAQQLTLLTVPESAGTALKNSSAHSRFQLSRTTRERGLAHIAEIRRQLAESKAERESAHTHRLPPRHPHAA